MKYRISTTNELRLRIGFYAWLPLKPANATYPILNSGATCDCPAGTDLITCGRNCKDAITWHTCCSNGNWPLPEHYYTEFRNYLPQISHGVVSNEDPFNPGQYLVDYIVVYDWPDGLSFNTSQTYSGGMWDQWWHLKQDGPQSGEGGTLDLNQLLQSPQLAGNGYNNLGMVHFPPELGLHFRAP